MDMIQKLLVSRSIRDVLNGSSIVCSSPHRLSVGGLWDLKALALPYNYINPSSINFALSLRTTVELIPYIDGYIKVNNESYRFEDISFDTSNGLILSIISCFNLHGFEVLIKSDAPPRSGLGGSGVLSVCLIAALDKARCVASGNTPCRNPQDIILLAHNIEDGMRYSHTGLQDQCAAVYGGVNKWEWNYTSTSNIYHKTKILSSDLYDELSSRILLVYLGIEHVSSNINRDIINSVLSSKCRHIWFRINDIVSELAMAINTLDWSKIISLVDEENDIYLDYVPDRITSIGRLLQEDAKSIEGGFNIAGAGGGGCVWTICRDQESASELRLVWEDRLRNVPNSRFLDIGIDDRGLII